MAEQIIFTSQSYGIRAADWPAIRSLLVHYGFSSDQATNFQNRLIPDWDRLVSRVRTTLFERTRVFAALRDRLGRQPTFIEEGRELASVWDGWVRTGKVKTIIFVIRTARQAGAMLEFDRTLMVPGPSGGAIRVQTYTYPPAIQDDPDPLAFKPSLPFNCRGLFGGVNITEGIFSGKAIRPNLFKLVGLSKDNYTSVPVQWKANPMGGADMVTASFDVPSFLTMQWDSIYHQIIVSGDSKQEYMTNLSTSLGGNASIEGFGMEFKSSFNETDFTETFKKYASVYEVQQVYKLSLKEADAQKVQALLTDDAVNDFRNLTAPEIVSQYGTHFMTSATFGGLKRTSSVLDVRDDNISKDFGLSLSLKVSEIDPETGNTDSGGADTGSQSKTVQKIHSVLEVATTDSLGGEHGDSDADWVHSLFTNPSVASYEIQPIELLIADTAKAAAVKAEVQTRLDAARVTNDYKAQIMWSPLQFVASDKGSGSLTDIATCAPMTKDGWRYLGHYGMGPTYNDNWINNSNTYQGLLIRDVPNANPPLIVAPTGNWRAWGMRSPRGYGLFEMTGPDEYEALSGFFFSKEWIDTNQDLSYACMVHKDELTIESGWDYPMWADQGTRSRDTGSAWSIIQAPEDQVGTAIAIIPTGEPKCNFFRSGTTSSQPENTPRRLNFAKCKLLENQWLLQ